MQRLFIANRGEIAIRIAQTAADMGIETVAAYSEDDSQSLHTRVCDQAVALDGTGPAAYLDIAGIVAAAKTVWPAASGRSHTLFGLSVAVFLISLIPLTPVWPMDWPGVWVLWMVAVVAIAPVLAALRLITTRL